MNSRTQRQNLIWNNRQIENRVAVAEQLNEVAHTIQKVAADLYDIAAVSGDMEQRVKKIMQKRHVLVKQIWMMEKPDEKMKLFLTMRVRGGQCIAVSEVASILSEMYDRRLVPARDSRAIVNSDVRTVLFVEDTNYKVLYGVAKVTKENETVSGDNYVRTQEKNSLSCACRMEWGQGWRRARRARR